MQRYLTGSALCLLENLRPQENLSSLGSAGHPHSCLSLRGHLTLASRTVHRLLSSTTIWENLGKHEKIGLGCGLACKYVGKAKGRHFAMVLNGFVRRHCLALLVWLAIWTSGRLQRWNTVPQLPLVPLESLR